MNNKKLGNDFETELCEILSSYGFWAHNFANRSNGQPADIIACRSNTSLLIDAKECTKDRFALSRIEDNQHDAMSKWLSTVNMRALFALKLADGEIYVVPYYKIKDMEGSIARKQIVQLGTELREYLEWIVS